MNLPYAYRQVRVFPLSIKPPSFLGISHELRQKLSNSNSKLSKQRTETGILKATGEVLHIIATSVQQFQVSHPDVNGRNWLNCC